MAYYQGDYYMAGQAFPKAPLSFKSPAAAPGGGFLSGINWGAVAKGAAEVGSMFLPGIVGTGVRAASSLIPSGGTPGGIAALAAGAPGLVGRRRGRRMNVTNVRALRRGMRRVQGFAKLARQTVSFTQRVKMKKRRRR